MMTRALLWPTFALVALIFGMGLYLLHRRIGHMRRNPPQPAHFTSAEATRAYFQPVELPAANLANLFETPVLYFALVPLLLLTGQGGVAQVTLAWCYVALRTGHSLAHIAAWLRLRMGLFLASFAVLSAMWVGFAIDIGFVPG